jgi:hypothetical protein
MVLYVRLEADGGFLAATWQTVIAGQRVGVACIRNADTGREGLGASPSNHLE